MHVDEPTHLFKPEGNQIQHGGELAEDDGLGRGVSLQHVVHLLPEGFDLGAALEICALDAAQDVALLAAQSLHCSLHA